LAQTAREGESLDPAPGGQRSDRVPRGHRADRTAIHWNDRQAFEGAGAVPLPADAAFPETVTLSCISGQRIRYGLDEDCSFA